MNSNLFEALSKNRPFLIMAHRGFWGGNVPENSIESVTLAYKAGADVAEVDVCRSSDGKYYLFHDGSEPRLLGRKENFHSLSSLEIENSVLYNTIGAPSGHQITSLSTFLDWLPSGKLVNLDRSWKYWEDPHFFDLLSASGKQEQLVLKSPVEEKWLQDFSNNGIGFYYMPIVEKKQEWDQVLAYHKVDTIGLELVTMDLHSSFNTEAKWLEQAKEEGMLFVANAESLGEGFNLFGGESDDTALFDERQWDAFLQCGIDIIQTDWPNFLDAYRKTQNRLVNK